MPDLSDPARLAAVQATGLLDADARGAFDRLARVAQRALGGSFAVVNVVTGDRQITRGRAGAGGADDDAAVRDGICHHTVAAGDPLVIPDTAADARVCDLALVRGGGIGAYVGVPLRMPGGAVVGAFAVCDAAPHAWTAGDVETLTDLAGAVVAEVAARAALRERAQALAGQRDRSESRFRALFDGVSVLTGLLDTDGVVVEANETALAFAGLDRDAVVGRPLWESLAVRPGVDARHRDAVARARRGETARYEEAVTDADGRARVLEVQVRPAGDGLLLLEGKDVTEAVRLRRVQSAMMVGLAGTWEFDVATGQVTTDGGADDLFEFDPVGRTRPVSDFYERIHPDDRQDVADAVAASVGAAGDHLVRYRIVRSDGEVRWVRSQGVVVTDREGRPVRMVGALADVTDQRREAEAAADAAAELQLALDAGAMGRWEAGLDGGPVTQDARVREIHGTPPGSAPLPFDAVVATVHPDDRDHVLARYAALSGSAPGTPFDDEYRVVRPSGEVAWVRLAGQVRDDGQGRRVVGMAWDVTGAREAQADLRRSQRQLRLALLAARLGTFDHDLATDAVAFDDRALSVLGLGADDGLDALAARVHPDDAGVIAGVHERFGQDPGADPVTVEYRLAHDDGWRTVQVSARGVAGADGALARVTGTVRDVTTERQAQADLRDVAARRALLLDLAQTWRQSDDPDHVLAATAQALGRHLGAQRVGVVEIRPDDTFDFAAGPSWTDGTLPPLALTLPAAAFGPAAAQGREGQTVAVDDVATDPRTAGSVFDDLGVGASVGVPILRGAAWRAGLYVHAAQPRAWTDAEVALVRDVADQAWDAVERTRAVAAVRESEARYRTLFNSVTVGFAIIDLVRDDGGRAVDYRYVETNETFGAQTGLGDVVGRLVSQVITGLEPYWLETFGRVAETGEPARRLDHAEGLGRWFDVYATRVGGEGSPRVALLFTDVTEQKRAEAALRESEARYRTLFESITVGFSIIDIVSDAGGAPVDYRVVEVNPAFTAQTGIPGEVAGMLASEIAPGLESEWIEMFAGVAETGEPARRLDHVAPLERWFDVYASRVGGPGSARVGVLYNDVTDLKASEASLRESEERFRTTFENAAVGIAHVGLDGAWLRVNRRLSEIVGYTRDELLARTFQDITHPDDLGADLVLFERLLAGDIDHYQMEKRYVHRDGHPVWINLTVALARDGEGWATHAISVVEDVSDKKAAEAELVALNAVLEDRVADRTAELARSNDELDRFAYVASHDLKAPIRAIDSLAAWIEEDAGAALPETSAQHLRLLRGRTARMEGLLDGLLAYSRAGRGEPAAEPVDVAALVAEAVETVTPPQGFDVRVEGDPPAVETARAPLALVVRNLIGNAIKHHDRPDGRVTVAARLDGGRLAVEVADDGPGIAPEYQGRVFEMFQTLRPRDEVEGSGMGLAIVKKTVEARGGEISVASMGRGTTFRVLWPLGADA